MGVVRVHLAVDVSRSMVWGGRSVSVDVARVVLEGVAGRYPGARATVYAFSDGLRVVVPYLVLRGSRLPAGVWEGVGSGGGASDVACSLRSLFEVVGGEVLARHLVVIVSDLCSEPSGSMNREVECARELARLVSGLRDRVRVYILRLRGRYHGPLSSCRPMCIAVRELGGLPESVCKCEGGYESLLRCYNLLSDTDFLEIITLYSPENVAYYVDRISL